MTDTVPRLTGAQARALRIIKDNRVTTWAKHGIIPATFARLERLRLITAEATGNVGEYRLHGVTHLTNEVAYRITEHGRAELTWYPEEKS